MPPISICPSAPMFQNRILNAGARPMPMHNSIAMSRRLTHVRLFVPKLPSNIASYTLIGLRRTIA